MRYLLLLFILLFPFALTAQENYTETFEDCFLVKVGMTNRSLNFTINPRSNGITQFLKPIVYRPSVRGSLGLGVQFKDLAIGLSFKLTQRPVIRNSQSESKYFDLTVHSYGKKLGYDIYYQDYEGYFIENLDNLLNNFFGGDNLQRRDDIRLRNVSANVFYVFNPEKFSYRAAFTHDERQIKSAGSFILTGSLGYFAARGDSSFIPPDTDIAFDSRAYFRSNDFYTLSVTPGYAYTLLLGKKGLYLSAGVSGLIGLQYHEGRTEQFSSSGFNYFLKGLAKASGGYNGKKWIVALSLLTDIQGMNTEFVQYRTNNLEASLFVGYRIQTKWMQGRKSFFEKKKKE